MSLQWVKITKSQKMNCLLIIVLNDDFTHLIFFSGNNINPTKPEQILTLIVQKF